MPKVLSFFTIIIFARCFNTNSYVCVPVGNRRSNDCTFTWMEQCNGYKLFCRIKQTLESFLCICYHSNYNCSLVIQKYPDNLEKAAEVAVSSLQVFLFLFWFIF